MRALKGGVCDLAEAARAAAEAGRAPGRAPRGAARLVLLCGVKLPRASALTMDTTRASRTRRMMNTR